MIQIYIYLCVRTELLHTQKHQVKKAEKSKSKMPILKYSSLKYLGLGVKRGKKNKTS